MPLFAQIGDAAMVLLAATGALDTPLLVGGTRALVGSPSLGSWV